MEVNNVVKLIDRLIDVTKKKEIKWDRLFNILDENGNSFDNYLLNKFLVNIKNDYIDNNSTYRIDSGDSFVAEHQNGYVYILSYKDYNFDDQYLCIAAQSSLSSNVVLLNKSDQLQADLKRLIFLIEEDINNIDGFISSFFD